MGRRLMLFQSCIFALGRLAVIAQRLGGILSLLLMELPRGGGCNLSHDCIGVAIRRHR